MHRTPMTVAAMMVVLSLGCKRQPPEAPALDSRQPVRLPPEAVAAVRAEMNGMLTSLNRILLALPSHDTAGIRQAAAASGIATAVDPALEKLLPGQFLTWGTRTHEGFDQLAASTTQPGAPDSVLTHLGAITQLCVTCHSTYRLVTQ